MSNSKCIHGVPIKVLTQIAIGLGAALAILALCEEFPFWTLPFGIAIYYVGLRYN